MGRNGIVRAAAELRAWYRDEFTVPSAASTTAR
jgi:hypothetical protein